MDAFDADVLIYAAADGHELGRRVRRLFSVKPGALAGVGSVLLLPELFSKPLRDGATDEVDALASLVSRLELRPVDTATAELATALGSTYKLRSPDAVHLATAVSSGADRFVTNNRKDFGQSIVEIAITFPLDLP